MARLTPSTGNLPLLSGLAVATALSGIAVFTAVHGGCDDPGSYRPREGGFELVGGCLQPDDLPVAPRLPEHGQGATETDVAP
ncbi:hypothetical protein [Saccharopolyspora taberi]|uniref:Secreted protein n=1 Tax=Saccharopolyspora taberi TaxID=60895 RepID=A0ABN3VJZ4_9PSEU